MQRHFLAEILREKIDRSGLKGRLGRWSGGVFRTIPARLAPRTAAFTMGLVLVLGCGALWLTAGPNDPSVEEEATAFIEAVSVEFPVVMNDRVEKWVRRFLTVGREDFQLFLTRETLYSDLIRTKLRDRGMPEDLLYIAMIESGFTPTARSRAEAIGVWQFMGPTARAYGLRVDGYVDERRDPIRATDAALDYLETLYSRFGSWYLAAAAYNAGPTRVARIVRDHAGDSTGDEEIYWEIIDHLPPDTREYVPKIIAAKVVGGSAEAYGFALDGIAPYRYETVWVPGGTRLTSLARSIDLSEGEIRQHNPHLIAGATPPGAAYPVRVPPGYATTVVAALSGRSWSTRRADDD